MSRAVAATLGGVLLLLASPLAEARQHHPARGHRIVASSSAALDGFTTPTGAYSFRKLKSTYAGPAIRIRRASDNAETDIAFLGCTGFTGCPWDEAAAAAHCAATPCFGRTWYDQVGSLDMIQATAGNQPQLIFNCNGTLPCFRTTTSTQNLSSVGNATPATGVVSFGVVANRSAGTAGFCAWLRQNGLNNRLATNNLANSWTLSGPATSVLAAASDAGWHSVQGVINGASSSHTVDGVNTLGTVTGNTTAGPAQISGGAAVTCDFAESIVWDNYIHTTGDKAFLRSNQQSFWNTP